MKHPAVKLSLLTAILLLYCYPLFQFSINNPNERVRVYMTAAMVDFKTFAIGYRKAGAGPNGFHDTGSVYTRWGYVNDKALVCDNPDEQQRSPNCAGTLYSAKAAGMSFLGYPFALLARLAGWEPSLDGLTLFLRVFTVLLPSLLFLYSLFRYLEARVRDTGLVLLLLLGTALGSMVFTYSHMFAGHVLTAIFLFWAFAAIDAGCSGGPARRRLLLALAGFCAGFAVLCEYPMALVLPGLVWYYFKKSAAADGGLRWQAVGADVSAALLGCLIPLVLMAWFHTAAFGAPWRTPYSWLENPQFVKDIDYGFMGLRAPRLENLAGSFFAPFNGMFYFAPWTALVLPAAFLAFSRKGSGSLEARAAALCLLLLTLFISCHSLWRGGWTLGPRYIVPFVPFAAVLIALEADRRSSSRLVRWLLGSGVLLSVLVTVLCSLVSQGFHTAFYNPLRELVLPALLEGARTPTIGDRLGLPATAAAIPIYAALLLALLLPIGFAVAGRAGWLARAATVVGVLSLCCCLFIGWLLPNHPPNGADVKARAWTLAHFEPALLPVSAVQSNLTKDLQRRLPDDCAVQVMAVERLGRDGDFKGASKLWSKSRRACEKARMTTFSAWATVFTSLVDGP